jgi:hypothetical protein
LQQRLRNPFFHHWGFLSGPVGWGEQAEETGRRELQKQTGLQAECQIHGFYRQRDFLEASGQLLEDKLFTVLLAKNPAGKLSNYWKGGNNVWMRVEEIQSLLQLFATTIPVLKMIEKGESFATYDVQLAAQDY